MNRAEPPPGPAIAPECPPLEVVAGLLRSATLAPSMHNTQPWRFGVHRASQTIELFADPSRMLRYSDPDGRAVHIGCGAALFNLRLAIAVAGREAAVRLLPDGRQPLLLATVRLAGRHRPGEMETTLHAAIAARHTNREPFSNRPVPPGVLAELADAAVLEGAVLRFPGHAETARLLELASGAERDLLADPAYRAELARWVGGNRDTDGIPDSALGPRDPMSGTPTREFTPGRHQPPRYAWFEESTQLAVLYTAGGGPVDWVRAGEALQRVLLTATSRGLSASPLTQPLETADAWLVADPQAGSGKPQMILRLGYGLPVGGTPRRAVPEVTQEPGAPPQKATG